MTVTVPKDEDGDPYDVVSNGRLITEKDKGETVTRHWRTDEPMASYLAHVSVGYFEIHKGWTDDDLPVYVAIDPDESDAAADVPDVLPRIVDWASERFGPYPFSSTGAVVDHLPGLDYALETQTKPYFDEAPDEALIVHELAHQWFGNSVTPRRWKDMWLSEGLATYAEWLWEEGHGGRSTDEIFEDFYDGTDDESKASGPSRRPIRRARGASPTRPSTDVAPWSCTRCVTPSATRPSSAYSVPGPGSTGMATPTPGSSSPCARRSPGRT